MKRMSDVAAALERAFDGLVDAVAGVAPGWLVLGVALHLLNQVARGRGWHAVVAAACAEDAAPRRRDAVAAWVAGAGAGGVVSARGGDAVRVLVLARRMPGETQPRAADRHAGRRVRGGDARWARRRCSRSACGRRRARASARRPRPASTCSPRCSPSPASTCSPAARPRPRLPGQRRARLRAAALPEGLRARTCCRGSWPAACCRLAALACFLAAFGLPATPAAVLLVVFAQCSGRLVPFSPASVGAGAAILAATFEPVTGQAVPPSQLAAFFVGTSTVLTVVGTALALAICWRGSGLGEGRGRAGAGWAA